MLASPHLLDVRAELGEGPRWDPTRQLLRWVDIEGHRLLEWDTRADYPDQSVTGPITAVATTSTGGLVAAVGTTIVADPATPAERTLIELPDADPRNVRTNDARADSAGRWWVGTMALDHVSPVAKLYVVLPAGRAVVVQDGLTMSNGLGWSPDGSWLYHVDTPTDSVTRRHISASGKTGPPDVWVRTDGYEGQPDGLVVDGEGGVWVAMWGGGCLHRFTPDGRHDRTVSAPGAKYVTAAAFGGADLDRLFITTAAPGHSDDGVNAGALFSCRPGVRGQAEHCVELSTLALTTEVRR